MNKRNRLARQLAVAAALAVSSATLAAADQAPSHDTEMQIRSSLAKVLPDRVPDSILATPVDGLYEVMFGPQLVYVTADGRFLLQGALIDLQTRENLTEPRVAAAKLKVGKAVLEQVNAMGVEKMVVYGPENPRHVITVFTDIDCSYCRRLHAEMEQYNARGIEVRYLLYPRAGENSESYQKAVSVWCADDRPAALTEAKLGNPVEPRSCDNPVLQHMALGREVGLQGTPALLLDDGELVPGYVPPDRLGLMLDQRKTVMR